MADELLAMMRPDVSARVLLGEPGVMLLRDRVGSVSVVLACYDRRGRSWVVQRYDHGWDVLQCLGSFGDTSMAFEVDLHRVAVKLGVGCAVADHLDGVVRLTRMPRTPGCAS
jgi:hypothetical protein